jgi:hypothetical protein
MNTNVLTEGRKEREANFVTFATLSEAGVQIGFRYQRDVDEDV